MKNTDFFEKKVSSREIFKGKVLNVFCDSVELPNKVRSTREYCKHLGAVCVVPLTDKNEVICVRQYRYAHGRVLLEIPAGKLDSATEDFIEAAKRELREETGAICDKFEFIGDIIPSPALISEVIHMYLARNLRFGETDFDDDELIEIVKIPIDELVSMIMRGEVPDSKTQAAVLKVYFMLEKEKNKNEA